MEVYVTELIRAEAEPKGPRPEELLDRLESLAIARAADDQPVVADALIGLARCAPLRADHAGMQRRSEESLQTARAAGDRKREATALGEAAFEEARAAGRSLGFDA